MRRVLVLGLNRVTQVPLFPLNTVVFPGVSTPLHIFEERYRSLVREMLDIDEGFDRVFGIIAIREGYEIGEHGMQSAHRVGTLVQLTDVDAYDDGRFDIEVIGRQRLRVLESESTAGEFLRGEIELLPDLDEPDAAEEAERARTTFEQYRLELSDLRGGPVLAGDLPSDPAYLSYGAGQHLPAHPAPAPVAARGRRRGRAAAAAAAAAQGRDAGDAGRALAAGDRGRAHPLVPQLR